MSVTSQNRRESHKKIDKSRWYSEIIRLLKEDVNKDGLTAREVSQRLYIKGFSMSAERQASHPRLTELCEKGVIEVVGKKKDEITDRNVAVYALVA